MTNEERDLLEGIEGKIDQTRVLIGDTIAVVDRIIASMDRSAALMTESIAATQRLIDQEAERSAPNAK